MPILHILFNNYANLAQVNDEKTKQTNMSRRKGQGEKRSRRKRSRTIVSRIHGKI